MISRIALAAPMAGLMTTLFAAAARAAAPEPWQMGYQKAATETMRRIDELHDIVLVIVTLITLFVLALLIYVMWRFNAKANPTPSKTTHNTLIEIIWTAVPVILLVALAVPSFRLLYFVDVVPKPDMTVKAIGHQWYWSYEYPDHGKFGFDATMVATEALKPGQKRLLETDNRVVVPVNAVVRVEVTADDVIHAWTIPAFGVKIDAVPGRLNYLWFKAEREGVYYGQCSELCGVNHGFMPIAVEVVSKAKFDAWVEDAKKKFARDDRASPVRIAAQDDARR